MQRQDSLKKTLAVAGGAALAGLPGTKVEAKGEAAYTVPKVSAMKASGWYTPNRAPLRPTPFSKLPPGDTEFKPVPDASAYGTAKDADNAVTFPALTAVALRLEAQFQDGFSGGILHWIVDRKTKPNTQN